MSTAPYYVSILFITITIVTVLWFYLASKSTNFLVIAGIWITLLTALGLNKVFLDTEFPPKLFLAFAPTLVAMLVLFNTKKGKIFIDQINLETITYLSVIRIPVEIVLALLYHFGLISIWQTFEGSNWDILSGISAPIVAYLVFRKKSLGKKGLLIWNFVCLGLLLNVVITSVLAIPGPMQQISFDQPNIGILYYPFCLLPGVVVPIVLLSHFTAIRQLLIKQ